MKQASIMLHISKETSYPRHNVTPIEAMYLVAAHHSNRGDVPVVVDVATIKEITAKRTNDDEIDRLKAIYGAKFAGAVAQVRDLPETFEKAIERGLKLAIPSSSLSNPNAGVVSSTTII